jgi:hypothetical protein
MMINEKTNTDPFGLQFIVLVIFNGMSSVH